MLNMFQAEMLFKAFVFLSILSFVFYLPRIRYYISGLKKPKHFSNPQKNRLAVIVPAKNERGLRVLLDSLARQTYDKDFFDTYIVVADEDDSNVELSFFYKNTFPKVVENQTCKGQALDGILKDLLNDTEKNYAGFIIVDADNVVDANFVLEMNNALVCDRQIILGKRCVKNYLYSKEYRSWAVNCNALIYTLLDKMGNVFRSEHNMSCTICGTGIMIRRDLAQQLGGWPYRSMTEDFELTITALLNNWTSYYYEYAVTYTEEGLSHKSANARRRRWLIGYAQVGLKYGRQVREKFWRYVKNFFTGSKESIVQVSKKEEETIAGNFWGCFEYIYSFVPLYVYFGVTAVCAIIFGADAVYKYFAFGSIDHYELQCFAQVLLLLYVVLFVFTAIALYEDRYSIPITLFEKILVLFGHPFFIAEYAGFYVSAFYLLMTKKQPKKDWIQVERMEAVGKK